MLRSLSFAAIAACMYVAAVSSDARAATIERYSDPVMGCTMLLSGTIAQGDAERLELLVMQFHSENRELGRICMNSTGGLFLEGVRLARTIHVNFDFGTAIAAGHVCESACAVAFMAGGYTGAEGVFRVEPIMHPRARLGFHAPSLEIPNGQYSETEVAQAYRIALQAVSEIVALRAESGAGPGGYRFPEELLLNMISTPPDSMYYIDTVGKAAAYEIAVYPVGINDAAPNDVFFNLCSSQDNGSDVPLVEPSVRRATQNQFEAYYSYGFGIEAAGSCRVVLQREMFFRAFDRIPDGPYMPPVLRQYNGDQNGGGEYASRSNVFPYESFPPSMRLADLPVDVERSWRDFSARVEVTRPRLLQCWLRAERGLAQVINVSEYVNLRREPDFNARILRQVPLGEQVRVLEPGRITIVGDAPARQFCGNACQQFSENPNDATISGRAIECIIGNNLWYEVIDARGNRGWVSRQFLQEIE